VNATAAAKQIRKLVGAGRYSFTGYCKARMLERGIEAAEVRSLLSRASECRAQANGRFQVVGDDLAVVVEIRAGVVVVTLFRGDEDEDEL